MEESLPTPPPPLQEAVQNYVLDAFGDDDEELGRDLLLSVARRVSYAREIHPRFGGFASVLDEVHELQLAANQFKTHGDPRRMREEAIDVMATCIRLCNFEMPVEEKP